MPINADKPHLWKADIAQSVDLFNNWFMEFAPAAYRETRVKTTESVQAALRMTADLQSITPQTLAENPSVGSAAGPRPTGRSGLREQEPRSHHGGAGEAPAAHVQGNGTAGA